MLLVGNFVQKNGKMKRGNTMYVFQTDVGRVRMHNEDSVGTFRSRNGTRLVAIADGMGGHLAGDVASKMTIEKLKCWEETSVSSPSDIENWLEETILHINKEILEESLQNEEHRGMGTTIVCVVCSEQFVTIAHIGDSRCYILRGVEFKQMTEDHSFVNELVKAGQISKEDAEHYPRKNILLRSLGTEETVKIDISTLSIEDAGILLLCSDGLCNKVEHDEMGTILQSDNTLQEKADTLVSLANERGGEDNITVALVSFPMQEVGE